MNQTPIHDNYNADLLRLIPPGLKRIVEIGSSSGVLGREYKRGNPGCEYIGVEIDPSYAEASRRFCDRVLVGNVEQFDDEIFASLFPADAFVFGDVLEHLYDPWAVLRRIRLAGRAAGSSTMIVACIPNAQHWTLQANLNVGAFVYQDSGLLDRTHIRWFTRKTLIELFRTTGYDIQDGGTRTFDEPGREKVLPHIGAFARAIGGNPQEAMDDATPLQFVVRAVPRAG